MKSCLFPTALATVLLLTGCGPAPEARLASSALATATVAVQIVERQSVPATEAVVGTVRPKLSADIAAKVSGRIAQMLVVPGQTVKAGEPLAQLDAQEIQSRLEQATAARQQAESDLKRNTALLAQKILSQSEFDAAQAKFRMAVAAEAEAKTMQGYVEISAPFAGIITRKLADVGDLALPGKPLLQMENPATLRFEADVPEALIGNVKLGDALPVRGATLTNEITGVVAEISPAADPNSRTFLVKLDLPSTVGLRSGQFGHVAVLVGEINAIRVPIAAVLQRGQMELVFVVADGQAQMRLVKTGRAAAGWVEIVSGLNAGERIATNKVSALMDGQPVTIQP